MKSAKILVTGRVQGVWFRDFVRKMANKLELVGWVKNNPDGSVSVEVEGSDFKIIQLIEKVKIGSPLSRVEDVQIQWHPFENVFNSFNILS